MDYPQKIPEQVTQIQADYTTYQLEYRDLIERLSKQTDSSRRIEYGESGAYSSDRKKQASILSSDKKGAIGPMQIMPGHVDKEMGYGVEKFSESTRKNPRGNVQIGTQ